MKKFLTARNLTLMVTFLATARGVRATEYRCKAPSLSAWFVFDDGPGGLDHFELYFGERVYTEVLWKDSPANAVLAFAEKTDDGLFEYGSRRLAFGIRANDQTSFTFRAEGRGRFTGQVEVVRDGEDKSLKLSCQRL